MCTMFFRIGYSIYPIWNWNIPLFFIVDFSMCLNGNLTVAYLTDAILNVVTRKEYLLNPCAILNTRLHPWMDLGLGSSLEYNCSVTQFTPGDYCYVKWWDGVPIWRDNSSWGKRTKVERLEWRVKALLPCFRLPRYFWFLD